HIVETESGQVDSARPAIQKLMELPGRHDLGDVHRQVAVSDHQGRAHRVESTDVTSDQCLARRQRLRVIFDQVLDQTRVDEQTCKSLSGEPAIGDLELLGRSACYGELWASAGHYGLAVDHVVDQFL